MCKWEPIIVDAVASANIKGSFVHPEVIIVPADRETFSSVVEGLSFVLWCATSVEPNQKYVGDITFLSGG